MLTNLHFNGGVRYDQYGDFDPAFNPRLALLLHSLREGHDQGPVADARFARQTFSS